MTDDSQDQPVLSTADRMLLKSAAAPTDAQLEATRRALRTRVAALTAGAVIAQAASSAEATGAATTAAVSSAATTAATATATNSLAAFGAAKWISAGLIVTAVAGGTVMATRQSRSVERPHTAASVATPAPRPVAAPAVVAAAHEPAAPSAAPLAPISPNAPALALNEAPAQAINTPAPRAKPARRAANEAKPARALDRETLSAELALLHDARQALARGDAAAALQALDTHAARFPKAVLRQEALSARALALCATGRTADARRAAAQLERIAPRSPHLIRLADSCALEDADPSE